MKDTKEEEPVIGQKVSLAGKEPSDGRRPHCRNSPSGNKVLTLCITLKYNLAL